MTYLVDSDCAANVYGRVCWNEPAVLQPVPLCRIHAGEVLTHTASLFMADQAPPVLRDQTDAALIGSAEVADIGSAFQGQHAEAVYFVVNGNRIKIGFTTNIRGRLQSFALGRQDVLLLLSGGRDLESALHRLFKQHRIRSTEWFKDAPEIRRFIRTTGKRDSLLLGPALPRAEQRAPRAREPRKANLVYPDGATVPRAEWPDLYRVFLMLCADHGCATKEMLTDAGPFASRDTVRRALDVWVEHGVLVRKAGRSEQFHLPNDDTGNDTTITLTR